MTRWTARRVAEVLGTGAPGEVEFTGISTDSRSLRPGELFVALEGERFDGHRFLEPVAQAGARGAVVRRGTPAVAGLVPFEVENTLVALGRLARARRREMGGPVVAVTGSNGKTATRAMLAASLATRWRTHATRENLNNLVGVPITILSAPDATDALVVECGASEPGEMPRLRGIVEPTVAVVTNVSVAHLSGFGSADTALREKVSLVEGAPLAVVGQRPAELAPLARRLARRVVTAGLAPGADLTPDHWHVDQRGRPVLTFRGVRVAPPLVGRHQGENAMVALAVAVELALDLPAVAAALEGVTLPRGRCEVLTVGDLLLINDTYNANPASFAAALDVANSLRGNRPLVALVGTMLELGPESASLHEQAADQILALQPDLIGATGEFAPVFQRRGLGPRLVVAPDADGLGRAAASRLRGGELVLLKASRGVQLERAIPHLTGGREASCSTTS